jgi:hypothetical protein
MSEQQDVNEFIAAIKDAGMNVTTTKPEEPVSGEPLPSTKSFKDRLRDGELTYDDIPDSIKSDWVRSILGGTPFSYKVQVLGGKISFVFCDLNAEGMNKYRVLSEKLGRDIDAQTKLGIVVFLNSVVGEVNIDLSDNKFLDVKQINMDERAEVEEMYNNLCAKLPVGLIRMLPSAWVLYSTLLAFLTTNALPDSF